MNFGDIFTILSSLIGLFFFTAGTLGLLRFPDIFSRLHALTKADNIGLLMIVISLLPQTSSVPDAIQLFVIWFFVVMSSAVASFLMANYGLACKVSTVARLTGKKTGGKNES